MPITKYAASPLNYTGGKYKLLSQIIPLFPNHINTFIDLFCGGCNVGINIEANQIICNDNNLHLINLFNYLKTKDFNELNTKIHRIINGFGLSDTASNGYKFYNCNSTQGLGSYNKTGYLRLREYFNNLTDTFDDYYLYLYVLIIYSFNNQIRFNNIGDYNLPIGKRDFNKKMQEKLKIFLNKIDNLQFTCHSFTDFNFENLSINDFVYADPPYLITCATYNENNGWNEINEYNLLTLLDNLNNRNIRFALSNILHDNEKTNTLLIEWLRNRHYNCHHLEFTYNNSNYQKKNKANNTDEVLITNY